MKEKLMLFDEACDIICRQMTYGALYGLPLPFTIEEVEAAAAGDIAVIASRKGSIG